MYDNNIFFPYIIIFPSKKLFYPSIYPGGLAIVASIQKTHSFHGEQLSWIPIVLDPYGPGSLLSWIRTVSCRNRVVLAPYGAGFVMYRIPVVPIPDPHFPGSLWSWIPTVLDPYCPGYCPCPGSRLSWIPMVLDPYCPGSISSWIHIVLDPYCHGSLLSWIPIVLDTYGP